MYVWGLALSVFAHPASNGPGRDGCLETHEQQALLWFCFGAHLHTALVNQNADDLPEPSLLQVAESLLNKLCTYCVRNKLSFRMLRFTNERLPSKGDDPRMTMFGSTMTTALWSGIPLFQKRALKNNSLGMPLTRPLQHGLSTGAGRSALLHYPSAAYTYSSGRCHGMERTKHTIKTDQCVMNRNILQLRSDRRRTPLRPEYSA